ncbi:MAG: hypothetical protein IPL65_02520 [Lewinellaceae bacterium]|nr:hypothetical protein [Lewinellaceae bacterium]
MYLLLLLSCGQLQLIAQDNDDLLSMLGTDEPTVDLATAGFKTNRVVNGHSIENTAKGVMDFKISHRFSPLRGGAYDIFGLDGATVRFGFDYGITDRLMVGIGRSTKEKIFDGFAKYKILRQQTGKRNIPVTMSLLMDTQIKTVKFSDPERKNYFWHRAYFTQQLLIGRKFSDEFSLQIMPTLVHRNLTQNSEDKNDVISLGAAGRIKLSKRVAFNAEYYYVLPNQLANAYVNSLSIGFDIETGGHVFQLHFTNSQDMTYKGFITETTEKWFFEDDNGNTLTGIRFGFNVSRVFTIVKPKPLY